MRSFCEGVVRRVDVVTPEGRSFVVEVTHEVILDREHRIRPGFQDFVMYYHVLVRATRRSLKAPDV
jgi:hypothetical protein